MFWHAGIHVAAAKDLQLVKHALLQTCQIVHAAMEGQYTCLQLGRQSRTSLQAPQVSLLSFDSAIARRASSGMELPPRAHSACTNSNMQARSAVHFRCKQSVLVLPYMRLPLMPPHHHHQHVIRLVQQCCAYTHSPVMHPKIFCCIGHHTHNTPSCLKSRT